MRKLYKHYAEFDKDDCLKWNVYEIQTEQIIDSFFFEEDAEQLVGQLENGKAFAGFTPAFMLRKVSFPTNINEAFTAEFS